VPADAAVRAAADREWASTGPASRPAPPMPRFRFAVQADYFARRIATRDLTGTAGDEDNEIGLEHARRALTRGR